jgi:hypothetical protein
VFRDGNRRSQSLLLDLIDINACIKVIPILSLISIAILQLVHRSFDIKIVDDL